MKIKVLSVLFVFLISVGSSNILKAKAIDNSVFKPHFINVQINAENGIQSLASYYAADTNQGVIFVPGKIFKKESWFFLNEQLQKSNITSLSLDGKTKGEVLASINLMKNKGVKKIALVGGSMGGAAVLNALDEKTDETINKVIVLAPYGGSPIDSAKINKLFVVAKNDRLGVYPSVKKQYLESSEPKKIEEYEGSEHAQHLFKGSHKKDLSRLIIDFIKN